MADEPRRSGRAGKGQNAKLKEDEPKTKGKRGKKANPDPEPEDEEEEQDDEENIRCICGDYDPDEEGRAMICCDSCSAWQHNDCMGLPDDYEAEKYFCERCKPENHTELLTAVKRGESAKAVASRRRDEVELARNTKKKGRKGRKSGTARLSEARDTPVTDSEELASSKKRKLEESSTPDSKVKKARGTVGARGSKKANLAQETLVQNPEDIPNATRRKSAAGVIKLFVDQIVDADKSGAHKSSGVAQDEGKQLGLQVEQAVYQVRSGGFGEPNEDYKMQIRAIIHNVKNNPDLAVRLMENEISAETLAAMEPKDMASDAQKQKDAELKINLEKQHTLVEEEAPRIRKTHKGDEYVDENQQLAESVTSRAPTKKESIDGHQADTKSPGHAPDGRRVIRRPSTNKGQPFGDTRRKSSANFNIDKVWSGVQGSPTEAGQAKFTDAVKTGSPPIQTSADPEIDNLLKDEEEASEPYSPREFTEEGVVWQGVINGGTLGTFNAQAKFAAGCEPDVDNLRLSWSEVIPREVKLHGRIQPQRADEYLCGLEYSQSTELIIVSVAEPKNAHDAEQFNKFFKYLKDKERYGVGMQHRVPAIKDIYLLPLNVGQVLPSVMNALQHSQPDPVQEKQFLIPIVIKWTELPHNAHKLKGEGSAVMSPSIGPPVAQTPITPSENAQMQFPSYHSLPAGIPPPPINGHAPLSYPSATPAPPLPGQAAAPAPLPTQSPASQNISPSGPIGMQNAIRILGPELANAPAVAALLQQVPNTGEYEMTIIRDCIRENPMAAQDLQVLTLALTQKNQARKESSQSN